MEAMKEDMKEYMQKTFQIKLEEKSMSETKPVNILDILDTMIVPNVEASVAANGVRENALACKETGHYETIRRKKRTPTSYRVDDTPKRGKRSGACVHSCANPDFILSSTNNCLRASSVELNYTDAKSECCRMGAQLAKVDNDPDRNLAKIY